VKSRFDVIVVGELNVDLIFNDIQSFPEIGKEKLAEKMTLTLGSSSAIFASNLSVLGAKVSFIGKLGNDIFGRICKEELQAKGVDTSMIMVSDELTTGATVVLNYNEDRAMVTHQGAMNFLSENDIRSDMLEQAKHLHFSSYFLQPGFKSGLLDLFKMAKNLGLTTSLDVQWDPNEKWEFDFTSILPYVDIFLPNELELLKLTKEESIVKAIYKIGNCAKLVVVKRGRSGSLLFYNDTLLEGSPFINEELVDAIGAGDSFNAGFIYRYLNGYSPEDCQIFGNLIGAISTTKAGGTTAFQSFFHTMEIAKEKFGYEQLHDITGQVQGA
jgi:sugar/nucleoside kinase (ribokinase family)